MVRWLEFIKVYDAIHNFHFNSVVSGVLIKFFLKLFFATRLFGLRKTTQQATKSSRWLSQFSHTRCCGDASVLCENQCSVLAGVSKFIFQRECVQRPKIVLVSILALGRFNAVNVCLWIDGKKIKINDNVWYLNEASKKSAIVTLFL